MGPEYKVHGCVFDKSGKKIIRLKGDWTSDLTGEWLEDTDENKKGTKSELWKLEKQDFKGIPYRMTRFSISFNAFPNELEPIILPTDSRRRLDRFYLERGYHELGTQWKKVGEFRQREDHRLRDASRAHSKDEPDWTPAWFTIGKDPENSDNPFWEWTGKYWDIRKRREDQLTKGEPIKPGWYDNSQLEGSAADFASYEKLYSDLLGKELVPAADIEMAAKARQALQERAERDKDEDDKKDEKEHKKDKRDKYSNHKHL